MAAARISEEAVDNIRQVWDSLLSQGVRVKIVLLTPDGRELYTEDFGRRLARPGDTVTYKIPRGEDIEVA